MLMSVCFAVLKDFMNPYTSTVHAVHKFIPLYNLGHNIFVECHVFHFQQNFIILCFRQSMEANSASLGKKQCDETQQVGLVVRKPTVHKQTNSYRGIQHKKSLKVTLQIK